MNFLALLKTETILFNDNQKAINKHNQDFFTMLCKIGVINFIIVYLITCIFNGFISYQNIYCGIFLVLLASLIFVKINKSNVNYLVMFYLVYGIIIISLSYFNAFLLPSSMPIIIFIMIFQMQVIVLDKTSRLITTALIYSVIYIAFVYQNKDFIGIIDELINTIFVLTMAIPLGIYMRIVRLKNYDYSRQSNHNENTDELTGLNNRRKFRKDCSNEYHNNLGYVGLAIIDIDDFKLYNDTYSHLAGDACLKNVANCFMVYGAKHNIKFFRYGGEEFVALVNHHQRDKIIELFDNLNKEIAHLNIEHNKSISGHVTISVGISIISKDHKINVNQQLEQADMALYEAKERGKNKIIVYKENANSEEVELALI